MAQDKIIRITADTGPLKNVRQEVQGLTNDINELNRSIVPHQPSPSQVQRDPVQQNAPYTPDPEKLRELEALSRGINEPRKPVAEETNRTEPLPEPEIQREIEESEQVETSKKKRGRPKKEVEVDEEGNPIAKKSESSGGSKKQVDILRQILKAVNDSNDLAVERTTYLEELSKKGDLSGNTSGRDFDDDEDLNIQNAEGDFSEIIKQTDILRQILKSVNDSTDLMVDGVTYLEELVKKGDLDDNIIPPPAVPPIIEEEGEPRRPRRKRIKREEEDEREKEEKYKPLNSNVTGIPGQLVRGAINAAGASVNSRNTFEAGAHEVGMIGNTAGSLVSAVGRGIGGMIPGFAGQLTSIVGELAGTAISGISTVVSSYALRAVAKAEELENNVRPYTQTMGVSSREAKRTAFEEGSYAARDLGMNAGEYLNRFADLRRAAGGKILGATEEDPGGVREIQSQLAAQRLFGLNQGTLDQLQRTMRFSERGEYIQGSSGDSPSGVIRIFENTMRELKLPFSEIASTMEESLSTFSKTAERVLDKAGEFDAGKIATVLSNVRTYTGMEGRQLERVQNAVTGTDMSQDPVTQALLMRVGREVFPEADTLSKLMAKLDRPQDNPELMQKFFSTLENMTDNEEQFAQLLKAVFPKLGWNDIQDFVSVTRGDKDFEELYARKSPSPEVALGNEKDAQYERSAARRTVGAIEAATAEKSNRDAANGEKMLGVLSAIDSKVVQLATDSGLMEKTTKAINESLDALVKIMLLSKEEFDGPSWQGSGLVDGQWNAIPEGSLLMNLLKKYGLD